MIVLLLFVSIILPDNLKNKFDEAYQEKISYNNYHQYIVNLTLNLCAIDSFSDENDKEFVNLFLKRLNDKPLLSFIDAILKPDLDRQRIFNYLKQEFNVFAKQEIINILDSEYKDIVEEEKIKITKHLINLKLDALLDSYQLFDIWTHYGLFKSFVGNALIKNIQELFDNLPK